MLLDIIFYRPKERKIITSSPVYFQCRRFIAIDSQGNEIEDLNNYGYVIFNDDSEIISVGMNKENLIDVLDYNAINVIKLIKELNEDDSARFSFLYSIVKDKGLYIGGRWHQVSNSILNELELLDIIE